MTTAAQPALGDAPDDAELARAAVSGDRSAFAAIYARYADRLFDFCVGMLRDRDGAADCVQDTFVTAASRLGQLREPDRLRSWLYAIARNEALARIRARRREQPSEYLPETASSEAGPETLAARLELANLISEACGGLSDRDRAVYELAYRQGLDGPELADALGVSHTNANTLVGRLRDNIERSLGALLVCRGAKADPNGCPELAALIEHWDGRFTVLLRKRVARHIEGCAVCEEDRRRRVNPVALLGSVPLALPAPVWLRGHTLSQLPTIAPPPPPAPLAGAPGAHASAGHGGVASAPGAGGHASWWPPRAFDTSDLGAPPPAPATHSGATVNPPVPHQPGGPFAPGTPLAPTRPAASAQPRGPSATGPDPAAPPPPFAPKNYAPPTGAAPEDPPGGPEQVLLHVPDVPAPPRSLPTDSETGHLGGHITALLAGLLLALLVIVVGGAILLEQRLDTSVAPAGAPRVLTTTVPPAPITTTPSGPITTSQTLPMPPVTPPENTTTTSAARPVPITTTASVPLLVPSVDTTSPAPMPAAPVFTTPSVPTTTSGQVPVPRVLTSNATTTAPISTTPSTTVPSAPVTTTTTFPFRHRSDILEQAPDMPSSPSTYCPGTHYGGPCMHP